MIRTVLKIDGMMCGMCEAHVNDAVRSVLSVIKVSSSHSKGETVIITEDEPDVDKLSKAITELGYKILSVEKSEYKKEKFSLFHRKK